MSILPQASAARRFARQAAGALLPTSCLLCGSDAAGQLLCLACQDDLPNLPSALCPLCNEQTTHSERCGACLKDTPFFDRTTARFRYDFPVDRIIHALKYGHQLAVANWLAKQMAESMNKDDLDLIIPMPLHPSRLRERGFNQSAEIARYLGNRLELPVDRSALHRIRATPPQAELPVRERQRNVRGAFECHSDFRGRHLLLIDDVMTTGATLNECARVLKLHGARRITVAVAARALKH